MKNVPEKIYLNLGEDVEGVEDFKELHHVSWCQDKIYENDIEYILAETEILSADVEEAAAKYGAYYEPAQDDLIAKLGFEAGAKSDAAKQYWLTQNTAKDKEKDELLREMADLINNYCTPTGWRISAELFDRCKVVSARYNSLTSSTSTEAQIQGKEEGWISVKDRLPSFIEGKDYSDNVFAICEGRLRVMAYCAGWGEDENNDDVWCHYWADCGGDITGDPEWDDDYKVTFWQPLPQVPA